MSGQHLTSSGGEKNIPGQEEWGDLIQVLAQKEGSGRGWKTFSSFSSPHPTLPEIPGALALPMGHSGAVVQHLALVSLCPLPAPYNHLTPTINNYKK